MRNKQSTRGNEDIKHAPIHGVDSASAMEVDEYGATKHTAKGRQTTVSTIDKLQRVAGATQRQVTSTSIVDQHGVVSSSDQHQHQKLHKVRAVKEHQATTNTPTTSPTPDAEAETKAEAKQVLDEAADKAETILAGDDAEPAADEIKWTRLQRARCHDMLDAAQAQHGSPELHQLSQLQAWLGFSTKKTREQCKQTCMSHSKTHAIVDGSAGEVLDGSESSDVPKKCESIAYFDSTPVAGVGGYCVLFSTKLWMVELDERMALGKLTADGEPIVETSATDAPSTLDTDAVTGDTDAPTGAPTEAVTGGGPLSLQELRTLSNPTGSPTAASPTSPTKSPTVEGPNLDLIDEQHCDAYEWCCLERDEVLQQIDDADPDGLTSGDTIDTNGNGDGDEFRALKNEVDGLRNQVAELQQPTTDPTIAPSAPP
jgi:hypothetical protein